MVASSPGEADRTPTAVTSLRASVRVSIRLGSPASPMYTIRPAGSTNSSARPGRWAAFEASTTASNGRSGTRVLRPHAARSRDRGRRPRESSVRPIRCTSAPAARRNIATSSPMVPGPSTSSPVAGPQRRGPRRPQGVAARLHQGAERRRPPQSGRTCNEETGTASCSARAPGRSAAYADLLPFLAHVLVAAPAAAAVAAAEHGVAHDPAADPRGVDAVTDRRRRGRPTRGPAASGRRRGPGGGRPSRR